MRVRALDQNGDWTYGKGRNNYKLNLDALMQNLQTRLLSFLGDCFFDLGAGIDWFNFLGSKDQLALNLAITSVILNTEGVTAILQLTAELGTDRRFLVTYQVSTTYGVGSGSTEVDITALS